MKLTAAPHSDHSSLFTHLHFSSPFLFFLSSLSLSPSLFYRLQECEVSLVIYKHTHNKWEAVV